MIPLWGDKNDGALMLEMGVERVGASSVGPEGQGAVLVEENQGRVRLHADHGVGGGR